MIESILIIAGISGMIAVILCVFGGLYFLQRAIDEGMPAYALIAVTIWIFGGILFIKSPLLVEIPESSEGGYSDSRDNHSTKVCIDGEPTGDNFDPNGIRLDKYDIKFENGKVYLISY